MSSLSFAHFSDTIVALATPQGKGALAIIRISGKRAFPILEQLFSKKITDALSHTLHVGTLTFQGALIDEVVLSLFKNPNSYTGEDIIEISCHASPYIIQKIIESLLSLGARLATKGEFTRRAFINGKLDLIQAESVSALIESQTEIQKENALKNMKGGFSSELIALKNKLIELTALLELELDFSEEDITFADRQQLHTIIDGIAERTNRFILSFRWGNVIKNGISIAIIGAPNAGKSTLLNTLLNEQRAIVSDIPGTTRDTIEEILYYKNIPFRFIDTAGLRDARDEIERIGIEKTYREMEKAALILYLFDPIHTSLCTLMERENYFKNKEYPYLMIATKTDLINNAVLNEKYKPIMDFIPISAKKNKGIEVLLEKIYEKFHPNETWNESVIITNTRHLAALQSLQKNLQQIKSGLLQNLSADLLSVEIKYCLHHIASLTGEIHNEHILDYIFGKFCIGK